MTTDRSLPTDPAPYYERMSSSAPTIAVRRQAPVLRAPGSEKLRDYMKAQARAAA